jgi:ACT domain-containing protein
MANEELIYRITRAIYDRLGSSADEHTVEQLVTEIYRAVEPSLGANGTTPSVRRATTSATSVEASTNPGSSSRIIISVFGVDHPGIVAGVAEILSEAQCSIVDINQTVVQGKFAMVIIADASRAQSSVTDLKDRLRSEGEKLGVHIYAQREDLFNAMHRI